MTLQGAVLLRRQRELEMSPFRPVHRCTVRTGGNLPEYDPDFPIGTWSRLLLETCWNIIHRARYPRNSGVQCCHRWTARSRARAGVCEQVWGFISIIPLSLFLPAWSLRIRDSRVFPYRCEGTRSRLARLWPGEFRCAGHVLLPNLCVSWCDLEQLFRTSQAVARRPERSDWTAKLALALVWAGEALFLEQPWSLCRSPVCLQHPAGDGASRVPRAVPVLTLGSNRHNWWCFCLEMLFLVMWVLRQGGLELRWWRLQEHPAPWFDFDFAISESVFEMFLFAAFSFRWYEHWSCQLLSRSIAAGQALQEHAVRVPAGAAGTVQGPAPLGRLLRALRVNRKIFASLQEVFEAGARRRGDCAGAVVLRGWG